MKISERQIKSMIKEERARASRRSALKRRLKRRLYEEQGYDAREDERLGAEHGAVAGKDLTGDHAEAEHARRDDAGFETRGPESHVVHHHHHHHPYKQGYDDREDERLAAEHGAEASHEQSLKDRRDDAGFEVRHENRRRNGRKLKISRRQLMRIIREESAKIKK